MYQALCGQQLPTHNLKRRTHVNDEIRTIRFANDGMRVNGDAGTTLLSRGRGLILTQES